MGIENIAENLKNLNIPQEVSLIAASKKKPIEYIEEAYSSGHQRFFGENYVQEAIEKIINLHHLKEIQWHFIGHLQSNKVKTAVQYFDMIQSVDSKKLAKKIDNVCAELNKKMSILIEVNIGSEQNKSGIPKENLKELLEYIKPLNNIKLMGFMCIPPFDENPIPYFKEMKNIYNEYKQKYKLTILSMGMSNDYEVAIENGANMVRVGTKIFGKRV